MSLIITFAVIIVLSGIASLVRAVIQAPEGAEEESGFSRTPEANHLALIDGSNRKLDSRTRALVIRGVTAA